MEKQIQPRLKRHLKIVRFKGHESIQLATINGMKRWSGAPLHYQTLVHLRRVFQVGDKPTPIQEEILIHLAMNELNKVFELFQNE